MIYSFRYWFRVWRASGFGLLRSFARGCQVAAKGAPPRTGRDLAEAMERSGMNR